MCGIVGYTGSFDDQTGRRIVQRMNQSIHHRGPDEDGLWSSDGIALAMKRLSIIDLSGGSQPMWHDETGIVFNGEIYNFLELRRELEAKGCIFQTRSDTEVILQLYCTDGINGIKRLRGMFSFCLVDLHRQKLFLVRDRIGIKPLYYRPGPEFYFSSEIKSMISVMDTKPELNLQAVHDYLTLRYVPAPETIWQGIFKLPPGCYLEYDLKKQSWEIHQYWSVQFRARDIEAGRDYVKEFEEIFLNIVQQHLVAADVPVGVMLSGGLDSSAVSAAAVELGHKNFHTFCVGFHGADRTNELEFARAMSGHISSIHHEVLIDQKDFFEFLPEFVYYADEPLADLTAIPLFYLSRKAKEDVKVVLSGEGSDEIFCGYDMEKLAMKLETLKLVGEYCPGWGLRAIARLIPGNRALTFASMAHHGWSQSLKAQANYICRYWAEDEKLTLWKQTGIKESTDQFIRSLYGHTDSPHPLDQMQQAYCDSWLVEDLLMKADRMSMAASLELRVPFLDHVLVEWAAALPLEWKIGSRRSGFVSKRILREFAAKRLPAAIINRPKQGFPIPVYQWFKEKPAWINDLLFSKDSISADLFDPNNMNVVLQAAIRGNSLAAHKIWSLVVLEYWGRRWIKS